MTNGLFEKISNWKCQREKFIKLTMFIRLYRHFCSRLNGRIISVYYVGIENNFLIKYAKFHSRRLHSQNEMHWL